MTKQCYFQWEAFNLLSKKGYILWVVRRCWKSCDVSKHGRHLGFYQELEIRLKPHEMVIFCELNENNT